MGERRLDYGELDAKNRFMPSIGKYVIEIFLVVSSFLVSSLVFLIHDARQAVGILAAFLAASARMAPAVLRIQQNAIQIKSSLGNAVPTLEFNLILGENLPSKGEIRAFAADEHLGFVSTVEAKNVDFFYASESAFSLKNVSFRIDPGTNVAIVGPSGSGKTTLVDVLLGIHTPVNGEVLISGVEPIRAIKKWPGAISYVPQSSNVFKGSIKENVALAFAANEVSDAEIWEALKFAHLENLVLELEEQILSNVGDRGSKLSGGQKQRIGIARAYLTNPRIVFFDEATSSLDDETDFQVTSAIRNLNRKGITTISIAHRKSTIALADKILYIKNGSLVELDNFGEFEKIFPSFQLEEDSEI